MLPPLDGEDQVWLAFDRQSGAPWLLRWDIPGAPGVWSATGYDDRGYPAAKALTGKDRNAMHTVRAIASMPSAVSRKTVARRHRDRRK